MTAIVPTLAEILNQRPGTKYPLHDGKVTTRCPRSDCFSLQRLSDASITAGPVETTYDCSSCGTTMIMIRPTIAASAQTLPRQETLGNWTYWTGSSGIHIRLANDSRLQSRVQSRPTEEKLAD